MRSNGLTASTYTPVADLEPPLAAAMLDDLRALGVAAYTTPASSTTMSGFDRPEIRDGVRDRLYVDSRSADAVRDLIARRNPSMVAQNDDLTFAQLVAGFDRPLGGTVAPWPVDEDLTAEDARVVDERDAPTASPDTQGDPRGRRRWGDNEDDAQASDDEYLAVTWQSRRDHDAHGDRGDELRDREEHFVPEPPAPLPHLEPYKQLAWAGVIGGPLALLIAALTGLALPEWLSWLAIVGFVGGFVTLVATMSDDDDWDPDDGAVV
jgi:hypothetical protein